VVVDGDGPRKHRYWIKHLPAPADRHRAK
jgi:hypothetical protein